MPAQSNLVVALAMLQAQTRQPVVGADVVNAYIDDPVKVYFDAMDVYVRGSVVDVVAPSAYVAGSTMQETPSIAWPNGFFNAQVRGTSQGQSGWIRGFTVEFQDIPQDVTQDQLLDFLDAVQLFISANGGVGSSVFLREAYRNTRNQMVAVAATIDPMGQSSQDNGPKYVFANPIPWPCQSASQLQLRFVRPSDRQAVPYTMIITLFPWLAAMSPPTETDNKDYVLTAGDTCTCDDLATRIAKRRARVKAQAKMGA